MFVAGTALPDWMNFVDRKNRARRQYALPLVKDADPAVAELAAGVLQHHDDDHWFHQQQQFVMLSAAFSKELKEILDPGMGHQAAFLGHISVELLLDSWLIEEEPSLLDRYYQLMNELSGEQVQHAANRILRRPEQRLADALELFSQERFLASYLSDEGLQFRFNGVMRRVGLPPLADLTDWLKSARPRVYRSSDQLLPTR